ncbi:Methylated-DNA--protein-cysteine methyltransferase [Clostridium liquoris]|jgi:methylated-DNA-[protein]-cysteine S-methyltransferase|uniref:Methylated-DNA--protein-cysteine methyltransferase n=1 Tax=Clostridium liquoris TaxID=1289519 RepID=A0A2T0B218_9CLOT|nr:methylated-DNA--[protein]-cysteine S-methyltransferase [Clostridium liquoris]PRR77921.1 Methylated-DNA--protein-cysteine methyltransferase [Clostridium liquoris]
MEHIFKAYYNSPIGYIQILGNEHSIISLDFIDEINNDEKRNDLLNTCITELDEYFKGKRRSFSLNLLLNGTDFQKKVWNALINIPYGKTVSYKDIAKAIGNEKSARAVGNANNKNKIAIIVPCHRVIGSNGLLTGYAGGIWRKEWLINHEKMFL